LQKALPYILISLLVLAIIFLLVTGNNKANRRLDERITLRKQDKIPYGTYVAYRNLKYLFPKAAIYINRREPGYWDSLSSYDAGQALVIVTWRFQADEGEMKKLITFAEHGNDVFISTRYISAAADDLFGCSSSSYDLSLYSDEDMTDSMNISLNDPPFGRNNLYNYPGKKFNSYFNKIDSGTTDVLGYGESYHPDFIHLRAGKGNFYVQLEPMAFSNYFLLHKKNIGYYENALSVINPGVKKIAWDEYYLNKRAFNENGQPRGNWLNVLFRYPALRAALLTALFTLLVYVLLEMRRKQRYIPVVTKPRNDSLDFVRTVGRLYYDKGDHKNLAKKMGAYFLEHIRNRYKLSTVTLDDNFIRDLQFKTGYDEPGIRGIVSFIKYLDDAPAISQGELTNFHQQLESFYNKT
jgi:hypothetical protein